jgi:translation initiation factor eIF-2B subunit beta
MAAQPREMVVGNIVRRVLGLIRDEAEDDRDAEFALSDIGSESQPQTPRAYDGKFQVLVQNIYAVTHRFIDASLPLDRDSPFRAEDRSSRPPLTSMFSLLSHPEPENSLPSTPGSSSPSGRFTGHGPSKDVRAEVLEGIGEIIDELGQVDDQIAAYALDHIHSNEIILTHTSSTTVQKFLLKAAAKRKFTVIHAESYPNNHEATHATVSGSAVSDDDNLGLEAFLMSRVNKVILGTHSVLANGGLVAAAGTRVIARAAKVHQTPVVVVSGVYKLSPVYPFDFDSLIEYGDPSKVLPYEEGDLVDLVDVQNPIYDYVPAELVDLYITNL